MTTLLKKILVPVDGSETSFHAMEIAAQIAKKTEAAVMVMHVIPASFLYAKIKPAYKMSTDIRDRILRSMKKDATKIINDAQAFFTKEGVTVDTDISELDDVSSSILETSGQGYDLIVMGSRGENQRDVYGPGSIARRIARHGNVPVLIVKTPCSLSKILACIDGSEHAITALRFAVRFGELMGLNITLINVEEPELHKLSPETAEGLGQHILSRALNSIGKTNLQIDKRVEFGVPADTILEVAEKEGQNIIAMSRVGHGKKKFLIGGVCEHVINKAKCSVLVVPPRKRQVKKTALNFP